MMVIVAVLILAIYLASPIVGKIALLLVNTVLPDPIPFVDEIIMWIGLIMNLIRLMEIAEFIREHKKAIIVTLVLLFVVVLFIVIL